MTAVIGSHIRTQRCGGVVVGDLDVKLLHVAGVDVLQHDLAEQVEAVVDVAGAGQLYPVGLLLDGTGPHHAHIFALDVAGRPDVAHPGNDVILAVTGDDDGPLGAVDGIFCEQISHSSHPFLSAR